MTKKIVFGLATLAALTLPAVAEDGYHVRTNDRVVYSYRGEDRDVRNFDRDRREDREQREARERRERMEQRERREYRDDYRR